MAKPMHPNSLANLRAPWKQGDVPNPNGRPKGSRNVLVEDFVAALQKDFVEHGEQAIAEVREKATSTYLRIVASLVPKDINLTNKDSAFDKLLASIPDGELAGFVEGVRLLAIACQSPTGAAPAGITQQLSEVH